MQALHGGSSARQTAKLNSCAACFREIYARVRTICICEPHSIVISDTKLDKISKTTKYYSHFNFNHLMKKIYFFAAAALLMAGCQNDEFATVGSENGKSQISFGMAVPSATRAGQTIGGKEAADKLGNNFLVHGFKYFGTESAEGYTDPTKQQEVFDYYNVNYIDGSANTTQTNTAGWEYAGYLTPSGAEQTVKYWDYEASGYVFSAVSGTGIKGKKIEATETVSSVYKKGWNVTIPAGGSLSDLYASARLPIAKPATGTEYDETVKLTFYSMATKVRFAIYETVPGYSVSIDRFYYHGEDKWHKTADNFAITGKFRTLNASAETPVRVEYYDNTTPSIENQPKVVIDESNVGKEVYKLFGSNIQAQDKIGTNSVEATYDQAGKGYTYILPYADEDNTLTLYVDYTLTAPNGETMHVKHASATVPAKFTQWKENFAYTYLFKISDKTNGTTGDPGDPVDPDDPDDPTGDPDDPEGLYPITFDACIVDAQDGIQETITSVTEPSITTYQNGTIVTVNDEYTAGDIYYTVMESNTLADIDEDAVVYEVNNFGTELTTEAVVYNWANNFVIFTPVKVTEATQVPTTDGTNITFPAKKCYKFAAKAGKLYAVKYTDSLGDDTFKLIKVAGQDQSQPSLIVTVNAGQTISDASQVAEIKITNDSGSDPANKGVLGARPLISVFNAAGNDVTTSFIVTEGTQGKYTFKCTDEFIKAGANGTYTVKCHGVTGNATFAVDMKYAFSASNVTVVAGGSTKTTIFRCGTPLAPLAEANIVCATEGISFEDNSGTYTVSADKNVAPGTYTATFADAATLTIVVDNYAFDKNEVVITKKYEGASQATLTLKKNGATSSVAYYSLSGNDNTIATIAGTGEYTITAVKGGEYTLSYEATQCKVTVNEYTLTADNSSIKKATGKSVLSLSLNGKLANAQTVNVKIYKDGSTTPVTSGFVFSANGQKLTFSNVTAAGTYVFDYIVNGVVVAKKTITVTD